jgi:hypothetical protein
MICVSELMALKQNGLISLVVKNLVEKNIIKYV